MSKPRICVCIVFFAILLFSAAACNVQKQPSESASSDIHSGGAESTDEKTSEVESESPSDESEGGELQLPEALDSGGAPKIHTGRVFIITIPETGQTIVLDESAKILEDVNIPTPVTDVLSGRTAYYTFVQYDKSDNSFTSWLYDLKGKAIEGGEGCTYRASLGSLVLKHFETESGHDGYDETCWLYDTGEKTGIVKLSGLERLTDKTALGLDDKRRIAGVFDTKGELLYSDPFYGKFTVGYCVGGYVLGYPESGCAVLNERLELMDTADRLFDMELTDCGENGVICVRKEDSQYLVIRESDHVLLGKFSEEIHFTDGVCAVFGDEHSGNMKLHNIKGKRLAGPYSKISPERGENERLTGRFLAREKDTVYLLNRRGEVLQKRKIKGLLRAYSAFDGLCLCEYEFENDWTQKKQTGFSLLTPELKRITSSEYNYIAVEKAAEGMYRVVRQNGEDRYRTDIINDAGDIIFKKAESVGTGLEQVLAVYKDGKVVLIDEEGNRLAYTDLDGEDDGGDDEENE